MLRRVTVLCRASASVVEKAIGSSVLMVHVRDSFPRGARAVGRVYKKSCAAGASRLATTKLDVGFVSIHTCQRAISQVIF